MTEQSDHAINYVILTQEILMDPNTNAIEKIVLARICGFDEFFESSATTAKLLHTTELVVQRAKRKLEKLGYIEVKTDTGRGKIYQPAHNKLWKSSSRYDKKVISGSTKKSDQHQQKSQTYNKDKLKKEIKGASAPADAIKTEKAEEYGNHDVNEFLKGWAEATGNDCSKIKRQRNAAYNLIKSNTPEGIEAILRALDDIRQSDDQYAPRIDNPSDLVGQYSKLPKLRAWVARQAEKIPEPSGPVLSGFPSWLWDEHEKSDEEIEAIKKVADEWRKKLPFMKNKGEGK